MEQRLGAVIPEPLKKLYLCSPRKYLDAPNCFVLPECLKNEDGKIRFLSGSQGVFDYAFEHLSPIVYRSEMDGSWSEYGVIDLCQYFGQKKLKDYAAFLSSSSSFCWGVI